jgi:hypothetical protein
VRYTFESSEEGWQFGYSSPPFTPPISGFAGGQLLLTSVNDTNCFGFWYSPPDAVPAAASYLYKAIFRLSSDASDRSLVPQIRLRANAANLQQYDYLGIDSTGGGDFSPGPGGDDYELYFISLSAAGTVSLAFDVLNFNPEDAPDATVSLDSVIVNRYAFDTLSTPVLVRRYDFTLGADGWTTGGAPIVFSMPGALWNTGDGALDLLYTTNTNTFGYWKNEISDIVIEQGRLYRIGYEVRSDITDSSLAPHIRLRVNTSDLQAARVVGIESRGGGELSPGIVPRMYELLYMRAPETSVGHTLVVAFDVLNFSPDDAVSGLLQLQTVVVETLDIPAP